MKLFRKRMKTRNTKGGGEYDKIVCEKKKEKKKGGGEIRKRKTGRCRKETEKNHP